MSTLALPIEMVITGPHAWISVFYFECIILDYFLIGNKTELSGHKSVRPCCAIAIGFTLNKVARKP
jgi:hypothetical protein